MTKPLLYPASAFPSGAQVTGGKPASRSVVKIAGVLLVLSSLVLSACTEKKLDKPLIPPLSRTLPPTPGPAVEPSSTVLGVKPAGPTKDSMPSASPAKSDMSAAQQSSAMPLPGQANDHSVLEVKPSQKPAGK